MPDMLVHLLDLPDPSESYAALSAEGILIHRPLASTKTRVLDWVKSHSTLSGANECEVCFSRLPVSCFIASREGEVLGYACYHATAPNFFGPTRVLETEQGKGIGKALLLACLHAMRAEGYVYGIIGGVGPAEFYEKCVGASLIPNSTPGIYRFRLKPPETP